MRKEYIPPTESVKQNVGIVRGWERSRPLFVSGQAMFQKMVIVCNATGSPLFEQGVIGETVRKRKVGYLFFIVIMIR